ncbi:DUF983 domain-containing protein [Rubellicoccus peritrichatus]|uniref:DUF983 domain-containing protein n=1 Tax=Rubellicoccus peritrichatus TaxID=3080537 RepID=A0AAQ3L732_9BACT|nr:DUF983 domain-containing protein [Puniceicoccus sp. CR14]WOO39852.1 DUF983 domain-containing protein [Puniceicoccus sp. CR14]
MNTVSDNGNTVSKSEILKRGLKIQCPNCGSKGLFRGWFRLRYRCTSCGLKLSRNEGFFLGAMVWNYGLIVFGIFPLILVIGFIEWFSVQTIIYLCLAAGVIGPMLLYRWAWGLWLGSYYFFLPHELPNNTTEAIPADEDE